MPAPLLAARFEPPPLTELNVQRTELLQELQRELSHAAVYLHAPAGFGKTTLLSQLKAQSDLAYLSVDRRDNKPARFLRYCMGAVLALFSECGSASLALLDSGEAPDQALEYWLEELEQLPRHCTLALDNLQHLEGADSLELLEQILDYRPPRLRLLLSGRSTPEGLALQRFQFRNQLIVMGPSALSFTGQDLQAYLKQRNFNVDAQTQQSLLAQTEGWPLALHLILSRAHSRSDKASEASAFELKAWESEILEAQSLTQFFEQELWPELPPSWQEFMLHSCVSETLELELAQRLMQDIPETNALQVSQTLQELVASQVFLTPLDQHGQQYRYLPIVRRCLYQELRRRHPHKHLKLHAIAAHYFAQQRQVERALEQAHFAQDLSLAAEILAPEAQALIQQGEINALAEYLKEIPEALYFEHSALLLAMCWVFALKQELESAESLLGRFEQQRQRHDPATQAQIANIRGTIARRRGQAQKVLKQSEIALEHCPEDISVAASAWFNRGLAYLMLGDDAQALPALETAQNWNRQAGQSVTECAARGCIASIYLRLGQLSDAEQAYQQVLEQLKHYHLEQHCLGGKLRLELARVAYEWNQTERMNTLLDEGLQLTRRAYNTDFSIGYFLAAKLLLDARQLEASVTLLQEALQAVRERTPGQETRFLDLQDRALIHQSHTLPTATLERLEQRHSDPYVIQSAIYLKLRQHHFEPALNQIEEALSLSRRDRIWQLRLLGQKSTCLYALQRDAEAQESLDFALELAASMRAIRSLSDECQSVQSQLIHRLKQWEQAPNKWKQAFLQELQDTDPQLLSARELELLKGLEQGLSNQALADTMIVSLNTIKTHLKNMYRKLEVKNRTQALARARELGLLP